MVKRVDPSVSAPGAPREPQRTPVRIGVSAPSPGALLRVAASAGLLGQEALEPVFVASTSGAAAGGLVTGDLDVAIVDLATFLGERLLGWDGLAIAAFGPQPVDRAVAVAIVEADTWRHRRDVCERLVRAAIRAVSHVRARSGALVGIAAADVDGWWADLRPSAEELSDVARWIEGPAPAELRDGLAWESSPDVG